MPFGALIFGRGGRGGELGMGDGGGFGMGDEGGGSGGRRKESRNQAIAKSVEYSLAPAVL